MRLSVGTPHAPSVPVLSIPHMTGVKGNGVHCLDVNHSAGPIALSQCLILCPLVPRLQDLLLLHHISLHIGGAVSARALNNPPLQPPLAANLRKLCHRGFAAEFVLCMPLHELESETEMWRKRLVQSSMRR